jgi:3,4-dihydroxy-2-butanone 4-phosphate synthase
VVVVDADDRENEGDLTIAAQFATPEAVNFMTKEGRGLICLCLTEQRCDELGLRQMTERNETPYGTAFTVSVEAREGVTTGISAPDRSHTIQVAVDPRSTGEDLVQPGHVFPLRARDGGVLMRAGQTEAAVDLARLAGLIPAGVVCEIMNEDGTMARVPDLIPYCERHGLKLVTGRRPDRVPASARAARRAHDDGADADALRRLHRGRVPRVADGQAPHRARQGRRRRRRERPRSRPLRVPDRRRVPFAQVRLR